MNLTSFKTICLLASALLAFPDVSAQKEQKMNATANRLPAADIKPVKNDKEQSVLFWDLPVRTSESGSQIAIAGAKLLAPPRTYNPLRTDNVVTLNGNVGYSENVNGSPAHLGLYEFTSTGVFTKITNNVLPSAYGQILLDGVYYQTRVEHIMGANVPYFESYDATTWQMLSSEQCELSFLSTALAQDPTTDIVYGVYYKGTGPGYVWCKVDLPNKTRTLVAPLAHNYNAIVFDNAGQCYAIDYSGNLLKLDKETGEVTTVGPTGYVPKYLSSACIDRKTGKMYWTVCPEDHSAHLVEVNMETGAATELHQFMYNDEIGGLYVPFIANDNAPAAPENFVADFTDGSMQGTVSFTAPTTLYDGTPATGNLGWRILANGEQVAEGTCVYGEQVSQDITIQTAGMYTLTVVVSNDGGDSPKVRTQLFIGADSPKAPANVVLSRENDTFVLTWDPVAETVNGGYMNVDMVRYRIVRYPDAVTVADNLNTNTYSDNVPVPDSHTEYYYTVQALCDGNVSGTTESNKIALGDFTLPYTQNFDEEKSFEDFTVIDSNADGKTWGWYNYYARITYNFSQAMDDWLVLPRLKLEAGKVYPFRMVANCFNIRESVQVYLGTEPTAESMTTLLAELLEFINEQEVTCEIKVPVTGYYYVGIHGCSPANRWNLDVDDISVGVGVTGSVPGSVTGINIHPAAMGELKATVSFTTPTVTYANDNLENLTKVDVLRDGVVVKTFDAPAPGTALSFDDTVPADGDYTYKFIPYNADGAGRVAEQTVYIGVEYPAVPENATIAETSIGTVKATWNPVTADINGNPLTADQITYTITDAMNTNIVYAEGLTDTEITLPNIVLADDQEFVALGVFAKTARGLGQGVATPMIPVGTAYGLPMTESFPNRGFSHIYGSTRTRGNNISWSTKGDTSYLGMGSYDGDDGFLVCSGNNVNDQSIFFSGKVDLTTAVNPGLTFRTYNFGTESNADANVVEVLARELGSEEWTVIKGGEVSTLSEGVYNGWSEPIMCDLSAFKGKVIQWGFRVTVISFINTFIDVVNVDDFLDCNLKAGVLSAPAVVRPNTEFGIDFDVVNKGSLAASGYRVVLTDSEGNELAAIEGDELQPGETKTYSFMRSFSPCDEEGVRTYSAKIEWAADENLNNNQSDPVDVQLYLSTMPAPADLTATNNGQGYARLEWAAPEISIGEAETVTEDFENFDSFSLEGQNGWTFVDVDASPIGGIRNIDIPNITPVTTLASFFSFDSSLEQFNQTFDAHSGNKYIASMFLWDNTNNPDDWAVSPLLSGSEQTVTFWARSYNKSYPERIEVYYTSGDTTDPTAYTLADNTTVDAVPEEWTEYSVVLPYGTKHFAIRSFGNNSFMFMVDDVTMEIDPSASGVSRTANVSVAGYNIYRNGTRINGEPVPATTYDDLAAPDGINVYNVTAVYSNGREGAVSNTVSFTTGAGAFVADALSVNVENRTITVTNPAGLDVTVCAADGAVLCHGSGNARVAVVPGVYLVKAVNEAIKVIVK